MPNWLVLLDLEEKGVYASSIVLWMVVFFEDGTRRRRNSYFRVTRREILLQWSASCQLNLFLMLLQCSRQGQFSRTNSAVDNDF
uniref:Uncharacterized protein n=1 Tax=Ditylenchus dipsaci TaxID=166011 RepID=A0A915EDT8_9BILA